MRMMFAVYWMVGCLAIGAAVAAHQNRCPADKAMSGIDAFGAVATWPAAISYGWLAKDLTLHCSAQ